MNKILRTKLLLAGSVAAVTFMVYLPTLQNGFVWDDAQYVLNNPFIRSLDLHLLKSAFTGFYAANWHPLTWLSHALDYAVWGIHPLGHHLTNNIIHALNTVLVVLLAMMLMETFRKTAGNEGLLNDSTIRVTAVITGLLFGLHPVHVESVAWVAERKDLLCAFFFLLSIITYTRYVSGMNANDPINSAPRFFINKKYLFALGFFALALLSKPMAVSLPFVLLILDWYFFGRIRSLKAFLARTVEKLPFLVLALISSILTMWAQKAGGAMISLENIPLASRLAVAARSLVAYLVKMILPTNLVPLYPLPENTSFLSWEYLLPTVVLAAITATCIAVVRKQRVWMAVWSYYVITLIPVLGIVQVGSQSMADRYTYIPSLGIFLILGFLFARIYERVSAIHRGKAIFTVGVLSIAVSISVALSYATIRQIGLWRDGIVFWNYIVRKDPGVSFAHNNLGNEYKAQSQLDSAIEQYQAALKLNPDYEQAHYNLGNAYLAKGLVPMAIEQYQTALRLAPDYAEAYNNLGNAYKAQSQPDLATEQYQTALRLNPKLAEPHYNLGTIYEAKRGLAEAMEQYREALQNNPEYVAAHYNLGRVYMQTGRAEEGLEELKIAVRLSPKNFSYRNTLGILYAERGLRDDAIAQFEEAVRLAPDNQSFRRNLERARALKGTQ